MAESGGTFWAAGFWADGFWADGFWAGVTVPPVVRTAAGGGAPKRKREKKVWKLHELQDAASLTELHTALAALHRGESEEVAAVADSVVQLAEPGPDEIALMATIADLFSEDD